MQQDLIAVAGAPEHREPTSTKRERVEWLMCVDCSHEEHGAGAAAAMLEHKRDSGGRCT